MTRPDPKHPDFNLTQYLENHGAERTQGYLDALKQFQTEMQLILYYRYERSDSVAINSPNTPNYVRKHLLRLNEEKLQLIEKSDSFNLVVGQQDKIDSPK